MYAPELPTGVRLQRHARGWRKKIGKSADGKPKEWYWPRRPSLKKPFIQRRAWWVMLVWDARRACAYQMDVMDVTWETPIRSRSIVIELYQSMRNRGLQRHLPALKNHDLDERWMAMMLRELYDWREQRRPNNLSGSDADCDELLARILSSA